MLVAYCRLCRHCRNLAKGGCLLSRFHFTRCHYFWAVSLVAIYPGRPSSKESKEEAMIQQAPPLIKMFYNEPVKLLKQKPMLEMWPKPPSTFMWLFYSHCSHIRLWVLCEMNHCSMESCDGRLGALKPYLVVIQTGVQNLPIKTQNYTLLEQKWFIQWIRSQV